MNLVNMALKKGDDEYGGVLCCDDDSSYVPPKYPYGTEISLSDEQIKALGFDNALPAGTIVRLEAKGIVNSSGENVASTGMKVRFCIQITDLGLEAEGTATDAASKLYGKK